MSVEIEVKAWAENPEVIRGRLEGLGRFLGDFLKEDSYWFPPGGETGGPAAEKFPLSGIRLRRECVRDRQGGEKKIAAVTFKTREVRDGIEVNQEKEFRLQDDDSPALPDGGGTAALEEMFHILGLAPAVRKRKRGSAWDCGGITAELHEVEGLGTFLELEILSGDALPETVRTARERLMGLLRAAGLGEENIETRYYTEMLRAGPGGKAGDGGANGKNGEGE